MRHNAVTSHQYGRFYAETCQWDERSGASRDPLTQATRPTLNRRPEQCSGHTYSVGKNKRVKGACSLAGMGSAHVLRNRKSASWQPRSKSMLNQQNKEKRNPPTSNRGVTRLPPNRALPCRGA